MLELKQKLVDACNQSGLPFEAVYFVIKDLWRDAESTLQSMKVENTSQAGDKQEDK